MLRFEFLNNNDSKSVVNSLKEHIKTTYQIEQQQQDCSLISILYLDKDFNDYISLDEYSLRDFIQQEKKMIKVSF